MILFSVRTIAQSMTHKMKGLNPQATVFQFNFSMQSKNGTFSVKEYYVLCIHVYTLCGFSRNTIMLLAFLTMRNHATYFSDSKKRKVSSWLE